MYLKGIRNISFRKKMTLIFTVVCAFSTCVAGILYYKYAEKEIVDNFTANAQSLVSQLENTLDTRLEAVDRRAFAALTNSSFTRPLGDYLNAPDVKKEVVVSGEAANWLKDIRQAEPLVHSLMIYTDKGSWDDYITARNWDFVLEDSSFWPYFQEQDSEAIQWLPAMRDEIFQGGAQVIPYVRRFTTEYYRKQPAYLIIQLDQEVLLEVISGDSKRLGEILITDSEGSYIAGTIYSSEDELEKISRQNEGEEAQRYSRDMEYNGEAYLMCKGRVELNGWQIYILKSKTELLDSVKKLQKLILGLTAAMVAASMLIVAFLSRQMTFSLQRLAVQMNRMRNGEMDARYYYPYKDEVGSLAKTFNYMADEIEKSMKKQEEYIAVLKEERDFVEQVQKQKRKAELRALQAQINPHFLYNTLNTITWMASDKGVDEIRILSNALGRFFRISLSRGAEVIFLRDEIEHVRSYLMIQEIRYAERMHYEIEVPKELLSCTILKLVLQPLVENAIYHGIKEKEETGTIRIRVYMTEEMEKIPKICLEVEDDGKGFEDGKLEKINADLEKGISDSKEGYGIFNVNERLKLYYGAEYGLSYADREEGARAVLTIPMVRPMEENRCIKY